MNETKELGQLEYQLGTEKKKRIKVDFQTKGRVYIVKKCMILMFVLTMFVLASLSFAAPENGDFKDVGSTHWAVSFINSLKSTEIISGYPDGTFKPQANVKINEFIAMTVKTLGYRFESMTSDWSKPYVDKAIALKIIGDKEFSSLTAQINREQMTSIVINAASLSEYRPSNAMDLYIRNETKDYHLIGDYYKQNVLDSYKLGIITGFNDKTFRPTDFSTRAEASAVLSKIINKDLRKPFVKADLNYTMVPTSELDAFGNEISYEIAYYAPLFNGKPVNELVDVVKLMGEVVDLGKGYIDYGYGQQEKIIGSTAYFSKESRAEFYALPSSLDRMLALPSYVDFNFSIDANDLTSKYRPYHLGLTKRASTSNKYPQYSTYIFERYGDQLTFIFKYLFESEFDTAWNLLKKGLDSKVDSARESYTINGRNFDIVYGFDVVSLNISIKK